MKKILKFLVSIIAVILLTVVGYLSYVIFTYDRIEDFKAIPVEGTASAKEAVTGKEYTIASQNMGFGAYTADFTFFMDGGKESRARSKESVIDCFKQGMVQITAYNPDIMLFQEIDSDSTRSHHTDQRALIMDNLSGYNSTYAQNYHSAYLMYPIWKPHGKSNSGMLTASDMKITDSLRRSFEISTEFSKFLDLDRCYSVNRIPVNNGKELVVYNVHASAYGTTGDIRTSQMKQLSEDMQAEYDKGNYCIAGGDFNADFTGTSVSDLNNGLQMDAGWAQPFADELFSDNFNKCIEYTGGKIIPTCRNCDIPYKEGNFTLIVDGFIVSDNIDMTYLENVYTGFAYSDHCPVVMKFMLKD